MMIPFRFPILATFRYPILLLERVVMVLIVSVVKVMEDLRNHVAVVVTVTEGITIALIYVCPRSFGIKKTIVVTEDFAPMNYYSRVKVPVL